MKISSRCWTCSSTSRTGIHALDQYVARTRGAAFESPGSTRCAGVAGARFRPSRAAARRRVSGSRSISAGREFETCTKLAEALTELGKRSRLADRLQGRRADHLRHVVGTKGRRRAAGGSHPRRHYTSSGTPHGSPSSPRKRSSPATVSLRRGDDLWEADSPRHGQSPGNETMPRRLLRDYLQEERAGRGLRKDPNGRISSGIQQRDRAAVRVPLAHRTVHAILPMGVSTHGRERFGTVRLGAAGPGHEGAGAGSAVAIASRPAKARDERRPDLCAAADEEVGVDFGFWPVASIRTRCARVRAKRGAGDRVERAGRDLYLVFAGRKRLALHAARPRPSRARSMQGTRQRARRRPIIQRLASSCLSPSSS